MSEDQEWQTGRLIRLVREQGGEIARLRAALREIAAFPDAGFGFGQDAWDIARRALEGKP